MTIEVRQMIIKSTVQRTVGTGDAEEDRAVTLDVEVVKEAILTECRRLVIELLRERQER